MPRSLRYLLVPALLALAAGSARPAPTRPVVAGYERFHAQKADSRGGQLLISELSCARCHESKEKDFPGRSGPILDGVGSRVRASWLRKYLSDPHAVKPGATMPHLLADDPEKADKVEALVHLLASTGTLRQERVLPKNVSAGQQLFERSGCVACHGTRKKDGSEDKRISTQIPLGDLKSKYSIPSLTAFLQDPLHTRPGGRMPRILDAKGAKEVATYLLQGLKVDVPGGRGTSKYAYYEGGWQKLPDFSKLKPAATGTAQGFDLHAARRESNYALVFEAVLPIDQDGQYTFTLSSDDGSQLFIDDKLVVDNDGTHATTTKQGNAKLKKGIRKIRITFFQGGGEAALEAKMSGPGVGEVDLGNLVAASEEDLKKRPSPKIEGEDSLVIKPELVKKGTLLFSSLGCASCHELKMNGKAVASSLKAPAMDKLNSTKGCLSDRPAKSLPVYGLDEGQRKSIASALKPQQGRKSDKIAESMLTFNCYACHARDKVGGPQDEINKTFLTTQQEMGDEGRLPPPLDGVGAKLNPDYFKRILDQGVHDRPYMHTRMPGFGTANVGHLVEAFAAVDKLPTIPEVKYKESVARVKSDGRKLVGPEAMSCIKCHTFNNQKAEGVQGMDMVKLTQRLRRDWFHAYVTDPQKVRPGTRMPNSFVNGKSVLPEILDGTALQQVEAMWQYLGDGTKARLPLGVGREYIPLTPEKSAILYRNFIEGAGPRGIAVGYPEKAHLAFDANDLRIAMIWQGLFIDASMHWTDRGSGFQGPLGDNIVRLPSGPTFALLEKADSAWPASGKSAGQKFKGYRLTKDDRPTFLYAVGDVTVEDFPNASKDQGIKRDITLKAEKAPSNLYLRAAVGNKVEVLKDDWYRIDDAYRVKVTAASGKTELRKAGGKTELLWQPQFKDGKAGVTLEYAW